MSVRWLLRADNVWTSTRTVGIGVTRALDRKGVRREHPVGGRRESQEGRGIWLVPALGEKLRSSMHENTPEQNLGKCLCRVFLTVSDTWPNLTLYEVKAIFFKGFDYGTMRRNWPYRFARGLVKQSNS